MDSTTKHYWDAWLSPNVVEGIRDEPQRLERLTQEIITSVTLAEKSSDADRWHWGILKFIPTLNGLLHTRSLYPTTTVLSLVDVLWRAMMASTHDIEAQVRTAQALCDVLQLQKKQLKGSGLVLAWQPLFQLVERLFGNTAPQLQGMGLSTARQAMLWKLIAKARRYFDPSALQQLWALTRRAIRGVSAVKPDAFEGLGMLVLFAPTNDVCKGDWGELNALVGEWMECWSLLPNSPHWASLWMSLLERVAKHDWKGVIDWRPHLPRLFTHFIRSYDVPVSNAAADFNVKRTSSYKAMMLHAVNMSGEQHHIARLIVLLLRTCTQRPHTGEACAQTLAHLQHLASLLDNYFHPSNTGRWCQELSALLKHLIRAFMGQLAKQGAAPEEHEASIGADTQAAFVRRIMPLALRAQFSKDEGLSRVACHALSQLAYVSPEAVLPQVVNRFRSALETATATHQLAAAVTALARCVRPMLLAGWGTEEESGPQILAAAMMELLPGIDANDAPKTAAVMFFYVCVLSSLPTLDSEAREEGNLTPPLALPLYVEEWAEEVMSRLMTLMANLDTGPGHRTDVAGGGGGARSESHGQLFVSQHGYTFWYLCCQLFVKLPLELSQRLATQAAQVALTSTLPGVVSQMGVLLSEASSVHPQLMVDRLVVPMLASLTRDVRERAAGGDAAAARDVSAALETSLCWRMGLLRHVVLVVHADVLLPVADRLQECMEGLLQVPSRGVQNAAAEALGALAHSLVRPHCHAVVPLKVGPGGLEAWVDKEGSGWQAPRWSLPGEAAVAAVQQMIDRHLLGACQQLLQLLAAGGAADGGSSHAYRMQLHATLAKIRACLSELLFSLRDFDFGGADVSSRPDAVSVVGKAGPAVGLPGTRERVAEALTEACRRMSGTTDAESLQMLASCCGMLLCCGTVEYITATTLDHEWSKVMAAYVQPPAAGLLLQRQQPGGAAGAAGSSMDVDAGGADAAGWRKCVPHWASLMRVFSNGAWRTSQAAFRGWATAQAPEVARVQDIPMQYINLLLEVCSLATHRYAAVRSEANPLIDNCCKRFPLLGRVCMPHVLASLADVPPPAAQRLLAAVDAKAAQAGAAAAAAGGVQQQEQGAADSGAGSFQDFLQRLSHAAVNSDSGSAAGAAPEAAAGAAGGTPAGSGSSSDTQAEREGRVSGACRILTKCLTLWRLVFRDVTYFGATLDALMASRVNNSSGAQASISGLLLHACSRFMHPPALDYGSEAYADIAQRLLHLSKPASIRSSWRYTLTANVLALLTMPPVDAAGGAPALPFIRHMLQLLSQSDMQQLRQLAASGLYTQLSALVEYGASNGEAVSMVQQWLASEGSGAQLLRHFELDHAALDASEAAADKRGAAALAMQARLLNMTHDELLLKVVQGAVERLYRWPEGPIKSSSTTSPHAASELFVVSHAKLMQLLAAVAPNQAVAALRGPLEERVTLEALHGVSNTSDKAQQASCAEVVGGLMAAGAPFIAAPSAEAGAASAAGDAAGGWLQALLSTALHGTTLELADAWSMALRFGVRGILDNMLPLNPATSGTDSNTSGPTMAPSVTPTPSPHLTPAGAAAALELLLNLSALTESNGDAPAGPDSAAAVARGGDSSGSGVSAATASSSSTSGGLPSQLKRLKYATQCVSELCTIPEHIIELPPQVTRAWSALLLELNRLTVTDVFSVRQQLAPLLCMALTRWWRPQPPATASEGGASVDVEMREVPGDGDDESCVLLLTNGRASRQIKAAAQALARQLVDTFAAATTAIQSLRPAGSGGAAPSPAGAAPAAPARGGGSSSGAGSSVSDAVMVERPPSPSILSEASLVSLETNGNANGSDDPHALALSQVGVGLRAFSWVCLHGDCVRLMGLMLDMLPQLFRLQELAGPVLQKLSSESQVTLALAKHLPLDCRAQAAIILAAAEEAAGGVPAAPAAAAAAGGDAGLWSCRAAALLYLQHFYFRGSFLLEDADTRRLQEVVLLRLSDPKPEVRTIAGATLSGMLRGMTDAEAGQLRESLVARARTLFARPGRRGAAAAAPAAPAAASQTLERHATVAGLRAFLDSCPYDCPPWVPKVLMALVQAASASSSATAGGIEAAVRAAASRALSEFKRTHEQDSLQALRAMMDSDEWDSLQQVTSSASYFA